MLISTQPQWLRLKLLLTQLVFCVELGRSQRGFDREEPCSGSLIDPLVNSGERISRIAEPNLSTSTENPVSKFFSAFPNSFSTENCQRTVSVWSYSHLLTLEVVERNSRRWRSAQFLASLPFRKKLNASLDFPIENAWMAPRPIEQNANTPYSHRLSVQRQMRLKICYPIWKSSQFKCGLGPQLFDIWLDRRNVKKTTRRVSSQVPSSQDTMPISEAD